MCTPAAFLLSASSNDEYWIKRYRGTAENLVEAGIVQFRHLPQIGNPRRVRATFSGDVLVPLRGSYQRREPTMWVTRLPGKKGRYEVLVRGVASGTTEGFKYFMNSTLGNPLSSDHAPGPS